MDAISTTRLYGGVIAVVSGIYSVAASLGAGMAMAGEWLMLMIGVVAGGHGLVLLSPYGERLGRISGPLMVAWALVMLVNQAVAGTQPMGVQGGMVALASLMLVSGLIMVRRGSAGAGM